MTSENISDFTMDLFRLHGKVAVVTGGNTGLGQAYAVALSKAGADLFVVTYDDAWEETRQLIAKTGRRVEFLQCDLTVRANIDKAVKACMDVYGKIDILVNNAGLIRFAPLLEFKDEDWKDVVDIHLNATYYLSHAVAKLMAAAGGGKIINIGSMLSYHGSKFAVSYAASKSGVAGLTRAFASELAANNIQVNAIAPGYILSSAGAAFFGDNNDLKSLIPAGRFGYPFDCMGIAIFLASGASDYVTGQVFPVDGGYLIN
jgi:2-dehydro-3-deoxy-D-gluconate 5-dehydrogenase